MNPAAFQLRLMPLNLNTKKFLIIEDYQVMRKAIVSMLIDLDAQHITEVKTAAEALDALKNQTFDIVICDYKLGTGKNGQHILEEARFYNLLPVNAVFVMISIEQQQNRVLGALDTSPDEYLVKPFNSSQLLARLQKNLERKHLLRKVNQNINDGRLQAAARYCDQLIDQAPPGMSLALLKLRADLALRTGDTRLADKIYRKTLNQREIPWAKLGMGVIAFMEDMPEHAIGTFENVIKNHPIMLETYDWLSKAYEKQNHPVKAMHTLQSAIELAPETILRQKKLANLADATGHLDIALQTYQTVIKLGEHSVHKSCFDFTGLAKVYLKTGSHDEALKTLNTMQTQFEQSKESQLLAAIVEIELFQKNGDRDSANNAFAKALKHDREHCEELPRDSRLALAEVCIQHGYNEVADKILWDLVKRNAEDNPFINKVLQACAPVRKIFPTNN